MPTPARSQKPAPETTPVAMRSYLVGVRREAANLSTVATAQTPEDAIKSASTLRLEAVDAPDPRTMFGAAQTPDVEAPPPLTGPVFARAPKPQAKK